MVHRPTNGQQENSDDEKRMPKRAAGYSKKHGSDKWLLRVKSNFIRTGWETSDRKNRGGAQPGTPPPPLGPPRQTVLLLSSANSTYKPNAKAADPSPTPPTHPL